MYGDAALADLTLSDDRLLFLLRFLHHIELRAVSFKCSAIRISSVHIILIVEMTCNKGRPSKVQSDDIINTILIHKNRIIFSNKIVSKHDTVWCDISVALGGRITPASLYTMVSCNRYGIRNQLINCSEDINTTDNLNISDSTYISNES